MYKLLLYVVICQLNSLCMDIISLRFFGKVLKSPSILIFAVYIYFIVGSLVLFSLPKIVTGSPK